MKLSVFSFRGIKQAVLNLARITIVTGANYQGKSSVLQALQAATCNVLPFDGLKKNQAKLIVNGKEPFGVVTFETQSGSVKLSYPKCTVESEGVPINISEYAAGLKRFTDLPTKERAKELQTILKSEPTKQQLTEKLSELNIPIESIERIWKTIETIGWDAAHAQVADKGKGMKGEWCNITGERAWGSDKAANWLPAEWTPDLTRKTIAELQKELAEAEEWYSVAVSDVAVSKSEIEALESQSKNIDALKKQHNDYTVQLTALNKCIADMRAELEKQAKPQPNTCECPNCKTKLVYDNGVLSLPEIISDVEYKKRKENHTKTELAIYDTRQEITRVTEAQAKNKTALDIAQNAAEKLAKMKTRKSGQSDPAAVEKTKSALETARKRLQMRQAYDSASSKNNGIMKNAEIIDVLAPTGLRQEQMATTMDKFYAELQRYSGAAKWGKLTIDDEMDVFYDGRPYSLLSKSERYRARALLQITFAMAIGDKLIIIDDLDELDADSRGGFLKMCLLTSVPVIIGMAESKGDRIPKLPEPCSVYVIRDGEVVV